MTQSHEPSELVDHEAIAVVGMAGRFPGAPDLERFWSNLRGGVESIRQFSEAELDQFGIPADVRNHPRFVASGTILGDAEMFDHAFFGLSPREADFIDPQHRIFLQTVYHAIENSGYDPWSYGQPIGVFAGANPPDYATLLPSGVVSDAAGAFEKMIGNFGDTLATRVAHRLNLTGPALTVQTACSTSLVAVHLAVESLLSFQCSMAIAGGVSLNLRQLGGYFYQEGMILSPDGHCRAFDAKANGTVLGQGSGAVVLKRLSEAVADGDSIRAVIRGSAVNNDGADKIGYTAPSESGQTAVIAAAQAVAGVDSHSIGYLEAHGTGTVLGDPIEIAALTRAFRASTDEIGFCHVGSVKTNIGHLDAAAGIAGLIKTILVLEHGEIPPTVHFVEPNPNIDFEGSPFSVNAELVPWEEDGRPRRAGVSSFGIGGTNAHVVLEEAPVSQEHDQPTSWQLLPISARSEEGLADLSSALADKLATTTLLEDAAHTLQVGRRAFEHRRIVVSNTPADAAASLREPATSVSISEGAVDSRPEVIFMFSGQGAQYHGMAQGIYDTEPTFRSVVDSCAAFLEPVIGLDLRTLIFGEDEPEQLNQTEFTQPALYVLEYALAEVLLGWGIRPAAVVGHSIGEYVAATLAGIMSRDDALRLVAERGRLMQTMQPGAMLSVMASEAEVGPFLDEDITLAAVNSTSLTALSGPHEAIEAAARRIAAAGIEARPLQTSHAFHSPMMDPMLEDFRHAAGGVHLSAPTLPILSNLTGTWMKETEATDPGYWTDHLRNTVRFADNVAELLTTPNRVLLEVGPGRTLATLARQHAAWADGFTTATLLRHPKEEREDMATLLEGIGRLWLAGVDLDWQALPAERRRIPLAPYPFQRTRHWAAPVVSALAVAPQGVEELAGSLPAVQADPEDWYFAPSWGRDVIPAAPDRPNSESWLVFTDPDGPGQECVDRLVERGDDVRIVVPGAGFTAEGIHFTVDPSNAAQYEELMEHLASGDSLPDRILHLWTLRSDAAPVTLDTLDSTQERGMHSLLNIARSLGRKAAMKSVRFDVVSTGLHEVIGGEAIHPENATVLGPVKVIPLEYAKMTCTSIDIDPSDLVSAATMGQLLAQLDAPASPDVVALRKGHRWTPQVVPTPMPPADGVFERVKQGGTYLVMGGLGGVGLSIARSLADRFRANLVLVSRTGLPDRSEWDRLLAGATAQDEVAWKIRQVMGIEEAGSRVQLANADITDASALGAIVADAARTFERIDGVIHAAGVVDDAGAIHNRSRQDLERVVDSKVRGTLIVQDLLSDYDLDFFLLCSSVVTRLYHNRFGQVGYVAANSFLEAFAESHSNSSGTVITVSWDDWQDIGMTARTARQFAETYGDSAAFVDPLDSFSPERGVEIFDRVLASGRPRVLISTRDLQQRIASDLTATSAFLSSAKEAADRTAKTSPPPGADYPGARTETESAVAYIWSSLLGVDAIGMNDDYFELGGDSLRAAQVVDRMRELFGLDLPINILFEAPTIAGLASLIDSMGPTAVEDGTVAEGSIPDMVEGSL